LYQFLSRRDRLDADQGWRQLRGHGRHPSPHPAVFIVHDFDHIGNGDDLPPQPGNLKFRFFGRRRFLAVFGFGHVRRPTAAPLFTGSLKSPVHNVGKVENVGPASGTRLDIGASELHPIPDRRRPNVQPPA